MKAIYNPGGGWGAAIGSDRNKCTRNIEFKGLTIWAHGQAGGAGIGSGAIDDDAVIEAQPYTAQNIIISAGNIKCTVLRTAQPSVPGRMLNTAAPTALR